LSHRAPRWRAYAAPLALAAALQAPAHAGVLRYCDKPPERSAAEQDRLLRFAAVVKTELAASGASMALVARSGLDLSRFGHRYSHAGVSLRRSPETPWAVRQLYYACDEQRPRLFDQGLSGFLLGMDVPELGYVSALLLPAGEAAALERAALDKPLALALLGDTYSANAFPFSTRYQNCNQWVLELLARAWSADALTWPGTGSETLPEGVRASAQSWLQAKAYAPSVFELGSPLWMWVGALIPWVHSDDHPAADTETWRYRVSMPASIEAFVRQHVPQATRVEFCHNQRHIVVRRGWEPLAEGCEPAPGDTVVALD
jgi:hypothetical protein